MSSRTVLFAVLLILIPVLYQIYFKQNNVTTNTRNKDNVEYNTKIDSRIVIGLNADVDYIVSAIDLLTALHVNPVSESGQYSSLSTLHQLQDTVGYSMRTCSGIERHFDDKKLFDEIVKTSNELKHEEYVGGNAALMANTIANISPDSKILLVAPVGNKLRRYLNTSIDTISQSNINEEIHIILEYSKGDQWGDVTATCANRVIISHDVSNSKLISLEQFNTSLTTFNPSLVILSGLHMLEGQPETVWRRRLNDISNVLQHVSRTVPIHLEMATVGNLQFLPHIADTVFPFIDSIGLNEQELVSLAKCKDGHNFDFNEIGPKPSITHTSDLLHWLYDTYSLLNRYDSRLSRIHFHSLSFHILVVPKEQLGGVQWYNSLTAALKGSEIASLQACDTKEINSKDFELQIPQTIQLSYTDKILSRSIIDYTSDNNYIAWNRGGTVDYNMVPVHVCKSPVKTVGLGDAISATGLLQSQFKYTHYKRRQRSASKKNN